MEHDVFISYSSKDKQIADAVCNTLEAHNVRCWYAPRDVRAGVEWTLAIMEGITHSHVMVLIWSSSANMSKDVTREVKHAFRHEVTVIPFRIEDIKATPALQYYLEDIHWLDALPAPFENHLPHLLKQVQEALRSSSEAEPCRVPPKTATARQSSSESAFNYKGEETMAPIEFADEEERQMHRDASRFARLLVSEISIYHQPEIIKGRSHGDLYGLLREDIDRSRQMYEKRVNSKVATKYDYFHNELVKTLADGDATKLGRGYPGPYVRTPPL